jgi:uncharacterized protein
LSLESKLNRILGAGLSKKMPMPAKKTQVPIDELISGEWVVDGDSRVFVRESSSSLESLSSSQLSTMKKICELTNSPDEKQLLFLDTETTGLAGGTGTFAFMVGVGKIQNGKFQTTQFFMPGFPDEFLLLKLLSEYVEKDSILVTFNGKTFDIPLLETRFILHRLKNPLNLEHIDLLHFARVIWRDTLDSCSLQSLERNILDLHRFDDTPGFMIPQIYFSYIRDGNADPIPGIFEHNEIDIVSMHKILVRVADILGNPNSKYFDSPLEILRVGKYHVRKGRRDTAHEYFQRSIDCTNSEILDKAFHEIGFFHKQSGEFEIAFESFSRVCTNSKLIISAKVEMAKHLEHRIKNFDEALEQTRRAIQAHQNTKQLGGFPVQGGDNFAEELFHRQRRLLSKLRRKQELE